MKKWLVFFAMFAFAFATTPMIAHAENFTFNLTGNGVTFHGTTTGTATATPGAFILSNFTGWFTDTNIGVDTPVDLSLTPFNGSESPICDAGGCGMAYLSPDGSAYYDDLAFSNGTYALDAFAGMLLNGSGWEVDLAQQGDGYGIWITQGTTYYDPPDNTDPGVQLSGVVSATPEPSSLALLGTGLLGACGLVRRKFLRA